MTKDELKLVLEALKWCHGGEPCGTAEAIAVIEKALAQPEQEPVGEVYGWHGHGVGQPLCRFNVTESDMPVGSLLYTTPPQRTWQGLTDEEIAQGCKESWVTEQAWQSAVWWAEAKLKEKNT